jgi:hypothetical protein
MLAWLKSWFTLGVPPGVFCFQDGQRRRSVDPFEVLTRFRQSAGLEIDPLLREVLQGPKSLPGAMGSQIEEIRNRWRERLGQLDQGIRAAFGVVGYEEGGLTQSQRLRLACDFVKHLAECARVARPTSASPLLMEASPEA